MNEQRPIARRSDPRFMLERGLSGHTQCATHVHLIDLNTSGCLFEYRQHVKPGTELVLNLPLASGHHRARCRVVHYSAYDIQYIAGKSEHQIFCVGVIFEELPDETRSTIHNLIWERLESERLEQPRLYIGRPAQLEEDTELEAINLGVQGGLFAAGCFIEPGSERDFVFRLLKGEVRVRGVIHHCQAVREGREQLSNICATSSGTLSRPNECSQGAVKTNRQTSSPFAQHCTSCPWISRSKRARAAP